MSTNTDFFEVGADIRDSKAPAGPIERKWSQRKFEAKLVNPANRRKMSIIVVGTGPGRWRRRRDAG